MKANQKSRNDRAITPVLGTMLMLPIVSMIITFMALWAQDLINQMKRFQDRLQQMGDDLGDLDLDLTILGEDKNIIWMDDFEDVTTHDYNSVDLYWTVDPPNPAPPNIQNAEISRITAFSPIHSLKIHSDDAGTTVSKDFGGRGSANKIKIEFAFTIDKDNDEDYKQISLYETDSLNNPHNKGTIRINTDGNIEIYDYQSTQPDKFEPIDNLGDLLADDQGWHTFEMIIDFAHSNGGTPSYVGYNLNGKYIDLTQSPYNSYKLKNQGVLSNPKTLTVEIKSKAKTGETSDSFIDDFVIRKIDYDIQNNPAPPSTAPNARFTWTDADGSNPGTQIDFDASTSTDDGTITTYEWDWNSDGTYDYTGGPTTNHDYGDTAAHTATLRVTDDDGEQDTTNHVVQATTTDNPPTASFTWVDADGSGAGTIINFDASTSTDDNGIVSYEWDLDNDGSYDDASGVTTSFDFGDTNPHTVGLAVTDTSSQSDTIADSVQATVPSNNPPTASFTYTTTGLTADFTDTSTDTDGTISSWAWDFGDTSTSTLQNPTHIYGSDGAYSVTLTVTDDEGATDIYNTVCNINSIVSFFTFRINTNLGDGSNIFSFRAVNTVNLYVDWGDGNDEILSDGTSLRSHTYSSAGLYDISLQGTASRISFSEGTGNKLIDILTKMSEGITGINSAESMFAGTNNFGLTPLTEPAFFDGVSGDVTDMGRMFQNSVFNQDISNWDVSSVTDMEWMFSGSQFNQDISSWDVSSVTDMLYTFEDSPFNQPIGSWDVSSVTRMTFMFSNTPFNHDISSWDVSNVRYMQHMFSQSSFNQDISSWDVSNVIDMNYMFSNTPFNQDISSWDVSHVRYMFNMFANTPFNYDIGSWDVSLVKEMEYMFSGSSFNQPIGNWDVSSVTNMQNMFSGSQFNQDISSWDVSSVTNMQTMFSNSLFNKNIGNWDVSSVTNMRNMFSGSQFNQDISSWDVSSVTRMDNMFTNTPFNQDISSWDVSSVTNMRMMFYRSSFNKNIGNWDVSSVTNMQDIFDLSSLSKTNYDNLLIGWNNLPSLKPGIEFGAQGLSYCSGETARNSIIANYGWTFNGDSKVC